MNYHHFAPYTDQEQAIFEDFAALGWIHYPQPVQLKDLWKHLFPQAHTTEAVTYCWQKIALDSKRTLADVLSQNSEELTSREFYIIALQLLGYTPTVDYQFDDPFTFMNQHSLPIAVPDDQRNKPLDALTFLKALHRLLVTRAKNGMTLLDNLAARGAFLNHTDGPLFFNHRSVATLTSDNFVYETVFVESDLDTDEDGQSDLLETTIIRPVFPKNPHYKVPALYTANPYFKGTTNAENHDVKDTFSKKPLGSALTHPFPTIPHQNAEKAVLSDTSSMPASENELDTFDYSTVTLSDYFLYRGYASVYAAGIGTQGSDGIRTTGSPAETESTIAIIEWLHGDRIAYRTRSRQHPITADWCNGKVAMTGKSYLGTLAIAAATTGVAGLETVISEAAISSWYDYYREHGLVAAPDGFPGEDADVLAIECFSRQNDGADYLKIAPYFKAKMTEMAKEQDRVTGSYNDFWEVRNYRHDLDNIQIPIVSVHGLNDWNVKPKNVFKLNQELKALGKIHKVILHQGEHIYVNNLISLDFNDLINEWLSHFLYGVASDIVEQFPDYLVQSNLAADDWTTPKTWVGAAHKTWNLTENGLDEEAAQIAELSFKDTSVADFYHQKQTIASWQHDLITTTHHQLKFKTKLLDDELVLSGRPHLNLTIKSNQDCGFVSVMLVDYGQAKRLTISPQVQGFNAQQYGFHGKQVNLMEFGQEKMASDYKLIAKGHLNLQNRQDPALAEEVIADTYYHVSINLQPTIYHLPAGHQLGLIIYSTDMATTVRDETPRTYTVNLEDSQLIIPNLD